MILLTDRLHYIFAKWFVKNLSSSQKNDYYKYMNKVYPSYCDEEVIQAIVHLFGTKIEDVTK